MRRVFLREWEGRKCSLLVRCSAHPSLQAPTGLGMHNSWEENKIKEATKEMRSPIGMKIAFPFQVSGWDVKEFGE